MGGFIEPVLAVKVSTHSRPKAAGLASDDLRHQYRFQHTAARRRLTSYEVKKFPSASFNTQPPEGGWTIRKAKRQPLTVSTHSRPKAAGVCS